MSVHDSGTDPSILRRLKWAFLLTLIVLFVFIEYARFNLMPFLDTWKGRLVMDLVILVGSLFFFGLVLDFVSRMQDRLERQNRELLALHRAALDIYGDLSLDAVLQKVVDQASQLLEARYGAVAVLDDEGSILQFVVTGISPEVRDRIGQPPTGSGLLGVVMHEGAPLRLSELESDPRARGFPDHHPAMHSLLAVPIVCSGPFRGNLYLTDKVGETAFTHEDEETLVRFATAAAIAIDNAHLHQRLRILAVAEERVRIAREMHDGMAQVLAYVNTKAQAVRAYLDRGRIEEAGAQLEQLAAASREVYTDVREGILALRTELGPERPIAEALGVFMDRWQHQSGIAGELRIEEDLKLPPTQELQLLRIIQEALSNIRKHSKAKQATVVLTTANGKLEGIVRDDGKGFDPAALQRTDFPRFGLAIMRERAESVGGGIEVDSQPGQGTQVRIELPLTSETA